MLSIFYRSPRKPAYREQQRDKAPRKNYPVNNLNSRQSDDSRTLYDEEDEYGDNHADLCYPTEHHHQRAMRVVQCSGDIEMTELQTTIMSTPTLDDLSFWKRNKYMMIKTLAIALSSRDIRFLQRRQRRQQYIVPGSDCCGVVVDIRQRNNSPFEQGDLVVAACNWTDRHKMTRIRRQSMAYPMGDYSIVPVKNASSVPKGISPIQAAALIGASPALVIYDSIVRYCNRRRYRICNRLGWRRNDANPKIQKRVLVIGARGGIGSLLCQLLRIEDKNHDYYRDFYVVGVTSQPKSLESLCDEVVDYTKNNVFLMEEYIENKFDIIVDLAGHGFRQLDDCYRNGQEEIIVKNSFQGGRFITTVPPTGPDCFNEMNSTWQHYRNYTLPIMKKQLRTRCLPWNWRYLPRYEFMSSVEMLYQQQNGIVPRVLQLAKQGEIRAVIDPKGPFPFTTQGVQSAFQLQSNRHAHGKVVLYVGEREN